MAFAFEMLIVYRPNGIRFRFSNKFVVGINKIDQFILTIVIIGQNSTIICFWRKPFDEEPSSKATSVNCHLDKLLACSKEPG